jgi:hypothetical protein
MDKDFIFENKDDFKFAYEKISDNKYKIYLNINNLESLVEHQRLVSMSEIITNLIKSNIKNLSSDLTNKINLFLEDLEIKEDNERKLKYFIYDTEISEIIIDFLKYLLSEDLKLKIGLNDKEESLNIKKANVIVKIIINIFQYLNNILKNNDSELFPLNI